MPFPVPVEAFEALTLVLFRITALFLSAPLFSSRDFPVPLKVGFGLLVSLVIFPLVPAASLPDNLGGYAGCVAAELGVGLTLGFAATLVFSAFQLSGQHVAQQMGVAMADVVDPFSESEVPVIGQFQFFLALSVYVACGFHRTLLAATAESFRILPLGSFRPTPGLVDHLVGSFGSMLLLSFQIAAPVLVALFLSTVALGFVSRAVPQINVFLLSFPIQIGLGLGMMIWTMPVLVHAALKACEGLSGDIQGILEAATRG